MLFFTRHFTLHREYEYRASKFLIYKFLLNSFCIANKQNLIIHFYIFFFFLNIHRFFCASRRNFCAKPSWTASLDSIRARATANSTIAPCRPSSSTFDRYKPVVQIIYIWWLFVLYSFVRVRLQMHIYLYIRQYINELIHLNSQGVCFSYVLTTLIQFPLYIFLFSLKCRLD